MAIQWSGYGERQYIAKVGSNRLTTEHDGDGVRRFKLESGFYENDKPTATLSLTRKSGGWVFEHQADEEEGLRRTHVEIFNTSFSKALDSHPHGKESMKAVFHPAMTDVIVSLLPKKIQL